MATMAIPIGALTPAVVEAKEKAQCVAKGSSAEARPDTHTVWIVFWKVVQLKFKFRRLMMRQGKLLNDLINRDFQGVAPNDLESIAISIDKLVANERELLELVSKISSVIRWCWRKSISKLTDQVEYLDSISQSLHISADPETSMLMGLAIEQLAAC